ncbi:PUA-like domain-containing protein [Gorgonomyces haynaldii]|nr:PUA-like domain-containing protein [Gorgonomyces haynaldii]
MSVEFLYLVNFSRVILSPTFFRTRQAEILVLKLMQELLLASQCNACSELLFDPITLPCGYSICKRCFRLPKQRIPQTENPQEAKAALAAVRAYKCPVRACGKRHRHRNEKTNLMLYYCLEKLFPNEYRALSLVREGELLLKPYWSPDQSICKEDVNCEEATEEELQQQKNGELESIISNYFKPAIDIAPHLQLPYVLRAKALGELRRFDEANGDAQMAARMNASNRRGIVAEKLVQWRHKMYQSQMHVLATCAMSTLDHEDTQDDPAVAQSVRAAAEALRLEINNIVKQPQDDTTMPPSMGQCIRSLFERCGTSNLEQVCESQLLSSDFECHMCLSLVQHPITTPCGHTWCRNCLLASLDHTPGCPMCRTKLPQFGYFMHRPQSYSIQKFASCFDSNPSVDNYGQTHTKTPLFICTLSLPGSVANFHMFEPRYRVMMKRAIETDRRLIIALPSQEQGSKIPSVEYGCLVYIKHFEPLLSCDIVATEDGNLPRYLIETEALHRVRLSSLSQNSAGYYEAYSERVEDVEPEDREQDWDPALLTELVYCARSFVAGLLSSLPPAARFHFERQHGRMPDDPSELSFWMASFLPLHPHTLYQLLPCTAVEERLQLITQWIQQCTLVAN